MLTIAGDEGAAGAGVTGVFGVTAPIGFAGALTTIEAGTTVCNEKSKSFVAEDAVVPRSINDLA